MSNKGKVFNFIEFSEINESLNEEDVNQTPAPTEAPLPEPNADGAQPTPDAGQEGAAGGEGTEGQEGGPQILKVYTDSEEDIQELKDAGIEIGNEEGAEGGEGTEGAPAANQDGTEGGEETPEAPSDVLYIKIKTEDGEDVILPFKEESEESRQPVEGEENTFDTELVATHNDYEFRVTAEIKVNPTTGEEEKPEVQEGEPVEEKPAEEGAEGGEGTEGAPAAGPQGAEPETTPNESFAFEQKIMSFTQFVNEGKREQENFKKGKQWEKALKAGKKKDKKKK